MSLEIISSAIGLILTLMVFSYLIGDNPLFRLAVHLFIGVASGYAAVVVWQYVLAPRVVVPLQSADSARLVLAVIPLILGISLFAKLSPRISWVGNFAMAILVGVGAATALGGAVLGTLIPQASAAIEAFDLRSASNGAEMFFKLVEGVVMLAGTVFTLGYFQFTAGRAPDGAPKRNAIFEAIAWVGRIFIAITLGVLFAGVYTAALTAMIERLSSMINFIRQMVGI
jgi:hypothetical protein